MAELEYADYVKLDDLKQIKPRIINVLGIIKKIDPYIEVFKDGTRTLRRFVITNEEISVDAVVWGEQAKTFMEHFCVGDFIGIVSCSVKNDMTLSCGSEIDTQFTKLQPQKILKLLYQC